MRYVESPDQVHICYSQTKYVMAFPSLLRHGHGTMWFPSGAKYVGQWHHDKIFGYGVMSYCDGSKIEGKWHEGVVDGCGLFTWPHGATEYRQYEGKKGTYHA